MNIALVVTYFPALSETFVLNQITGLIKRGALWTCKPTGA